MKNIVIAANLNKELVPISFSADGDTKVAKFEKQILKTGTFSHPQDPDKKITFNAAMFDKIIKAFNDGVVDNVPVILGTHDEDQTERIVGKVTALKKKKKGLYAEVEIVDDEVVDKIETKTTDGKGLIDEVSVSLGSVTSDDGTASPVVLMHLAIVTHAWFRGMDSFESLAASLSGEYKILLINASGGDLQDRIFKVRSAFYANNPFTRSFVEEVHDDFIIVANDDSGKLFRFNYSMNDDGIKFEDESTEVERVIQEVKADMTPEELLAALKEVGIEFDSVDDLKAALEAATKADETVKASSEMLTAVKAALAGTTVEPKKAPKTEAEGVTALLELTASLTKRADAQETLITSLTKENVDTKATAAVDVLVNAGKVTPAMKEHYVTLYADNNELYTSMTAEMPVIVDTKIIGDGGDEKPAGELNAKDAAEETKRILAKNDPSGKKKKVETKA